MPTGYCRECGRPFTDLRRRLCGACYQRARRRPDFQGWVDAAPVRAHIEALHTAGLGQRGIAERAGVGRSQVRNISVGRRAQDKAHSGPARYCLPATAAAILAIPVPAPDPKAIRHRRLRVALNPRQKHTSRPRKPTWLDRYTELKELGYNDIEIMRKWACTAESMIRQLERYEISPQPLLVAERRHELNRRKKRTA